VKLVPTQDTHICAADVSTPVRSDTKKKDVPDAGLSLKLRIDRLFNRLCDIKNGLVLDYRTYVDQLEQIFEGLEKQTRQYTRLYARLYAQHFADSIESITAKAREREAYYSYLQFLCLQLLGGGNSIEGDLQALNAEYGGDGKLYSDYSELFRTHTAEISVACHRWRMPLKYTLRLSGRFASDPRAWYYLSVRRANLMVFDDYIASTKSLLDVSWQYIRDILARRGHDTTRRLLSAKGFEYHRKRLASVAPLSADFETVTRSVALQHFYLSKPRSSIYWRQLDILAPFEISFESFKCLLGLIREYLREHMASRAKVARRAIQDRLKVRTQDLCYSYMPKYQMTYEEFVELSWVRLKAEEIQETLLSLHGKQGVGAVVYPSLGSDPARFHRWVYMSDRAGVKERVRSVQPVRRRSRRSRPRSIRSGIIHQSSGTCGGARGSTR
jgi:hypothetical protein